MHLVLGESEHGTQTRRDAGFCISLYFTYLIRVRLVHKHQVLAQADPGDGPTYWRGDGALRLGR